MPTIDQLPAATAASDADEIVVSQSGIARKVTRQQLLAGIQTQFVLSGGTILGNGGSVTGLAQPILIGANLTLEGSVLSASAAPYIVAQQPPGTPPGAADLVPLGQSGANTAVTYAQFMGAMSGLSGVDASNLGVTPTGGTTVVKLKDLAANTLQKAGGQMTGPLLLASDPALPTQAATKQYADARLMRTGDTMTGALTLAADPTQPLHAATKHYVDAGSVASVPLAGGTMTGTLTTPSVVAGSSDFWRASLSASGGQSVRINKVGDAAGYFANHNSFLLSSRAQDLPTGNNYYNVNSTTNIVSTPVNGCTGMWSSVSVASGGGNGGNNGHVSGYRQMIRASIPRGSTTVATALLVPSVTLAVADVTNFQYAYPTDATHNGGAFPVSATLPLSVQVGANLYSCIGVSGTSGPGTLTFAGVVSVADGRVGNAVVAQVIGCPIWGDVVEVRSFSNAPSSVDGSLIGMEMDLVGNGADDATIRRFFSLVIGKQNTQGPDFEVFGVFDIFSPPGTSYQHALAGFGSGPFTHAFIDIRGVVQGPNANAIWFADGQRLALDTAGNHQLRYNPYNGNAEYVVNGNAALAISGLGAITALSLQVSAPIQVGNYGTGNLPPPTAIGQVAFAANGRNSGEGPGAGTGCLVQVQNKGGALAWCAVWSGAPVTG
jgi:hypothetical protein